MEQSNQNHKIIVMGFVAFAATAAYVTRVLADVLAASAGWFARIHDSDLIVHGVPAGVGIAAFALFMLKPSIRNWGEEVVIEVKKVVWPGRKDTQALTVAVSFIILLAGVILWFFDVISSGLVDFILNFQF